MSLRQLKDRGDTIIEVLISIAIAGSILGGSYAAANQSLKSTRQAQERTEALKYVESQIEVLKNRATNESRISPLPGNSLFCIDGNNSPSWNGDVNNLGDYRAECRQGDGNRYHLSISYDGSNTHTVSAYWEGIKGSSELEYITIHYRTVR